MRLCSYVLKNEFCWNIFSGSSTGFYYKQKGTLPYISLEIRMFNSLFFTESSKQTMFKVDGKKDTGTDSVINCFNIFLIKLQAFHLDDSDRVCFYF